jgi:hypothetical protein
MDRHRQRPRRPGLAQLVSVLDRELAGLARERVGALHVVVAQRPGQLDERRDAGESIDGRSARSLKARFERGVRRLGQGGSSTPGRAL